MLLTGRRVPRPSALVLVAIAAVLTALLAGCGTSAGPGGTTGATGPTVSQNPDGTDAPTPAATGSPADGPLIRGTGYRFHAPRGWRAVSAKVRSAKVDRAAGARHPVAGFSSNLNVVLTRHGFAARSLDAVTTQIRKRLRPTAPRYRVLPRTEVDGEPAGHLAGLRKEVSRPYWLEQYVIPHGEHAYILSFSFSPKLAHGKRRHLIDAVLASWHWDRPRR